MAALLLPHPPLPVSREGWWQALGPEAQPTEGAACFLVALVAPVRCGGQAVDAQNCLSPEQ